MFEEKNQKIDKKSKEKTYKPLLAGIFLIVAGLLSILSWMSVFAIDISILEQTVDINQFQHIDPNITIEQVKSIMSTCALIGIVLSIFPLLGGILSFKKKLWGVSLACGIIGLLNFFPIIVPGILCLVSIILLLMSKKEFI